MNIAKKFNMQLQLLRRQVDKKYQRQIQEWNKEKNKKTQYLDATMGSVIEHQARMIGINSIEDIYLGYTCYFDTLLDLTKLPNLNSIHITGKFNYWDETPDEPIVPEPPERIQQIENELAENEEKLEKIREALPDVKIYID